MFIIVLVKKTKHENISRVELKIFGVAVWLHVGGFMLTNPVPRVIIIMITELLLVILITFALSPVAP